MEEGSKQDTGIIEYFQLEKGLRKIKRVNTIKDFVQKSKQSSQALILFMLS